MILLSQNDSDDSVFEVGNDNEILHDFQITDDLTICRVEYESKVRTVLVQKFGRAKASPTKTRALLKQHLLTNYTKCYYHVLL